MKRSNRLPREVREHAARMALDIVTNIHPLDAIESIAPKIGCVLQTLNDQVRKHEVNTDVRNNQRQVERVKASEREVRGLRKANEIMKLSSVFCISTYKFTVLTRSVINTGASSGMVVRTAMPNHSAPIQS